MTCAESAQNSGWTGPAFKQGLFCHCCPSQGCTHLPMVLVVESFMDSGKEGGGGGGWTARTVKRPPQQPPQTQYANHWAPLTCKRYTPPHPAQPSTPTTRLRERRNNTSRSSGCSGRKKAATRRNMQREERVTVQGPVKGATTRRNVTQGAKMCYKYQAQFSHTALAVWWEGHKNESLHMRVACICPKTSLHLLWIWLGVTLRDTHPAPVANCTRALGPTWVQGRTIL